MTWTLLTSDTPPQLRPRPADQPYTLAFTDGRLGFPALQPGDLVRAVPDAPGVFFPVLKDEAGQLGYDPDGRVALGLEAGLKARQLLGWVKEAPQQWLAKHPLTNAPTWWMAMNSPLTDREVIDGWRLVAPDDRQAVWADQLMLELAFRCHRPMLAEWLHRQGVRPSQDGSLFVQVLQMDLARAWQHLGGPVTTLPDGSVQPRWQSAPDGAEAHRPLPKRTGIGAAWSGLGPEQVWVRCHRLCQAWLADQAMPLDGPRYTVTFRDLQADRSWVCQHTAASFLFWDQERSPIERQSVSRAARQEVRRGWADQLDRRGLDWQHAGPQTDGAPQQALADYLSTQMSPEEAEVWRAWLRERALVARPATPARRARPRS